MRSEPGRPVVDIPAAISEFTDAAADLRTDGGRGHLSRTEIASWADGLRRGRNRCENAAPGHTEGTCKPFRVFLPKDTPLPAQCSSIGRPDAHPPRSDEPRDFFPKIYE